MSRPRPPRHRPLSLPLPAPQEPARFSLAPFSSASAPNPFADGASCGARASVPFVPASPSATPLASPLHTPFASPSFSGDQPYLSSPVDCALPFAWRDASPTHSRTSSDRAGESASQRAEGVWRTRASISDILNTPTASENEGEDEEDGDGDDDDNDDDEEKDDEDDDGEDDEGDDAGNEEAREKPLIAQRNGLHAQGSLRHRLNAVAVPHRQALPSLEALAVLAAPRRQTRVDEVIDVDALESEAGCEAGEVVNLISSEDGGEGRVAGAQERRGVKRRRAQGKREFMILDGENEGTVYDIRDKDERVECVESGAGGENGAGGSGEVQCTGSVRGLRALRDYPHFQFQCEISRGRDTFCNRCFCYVCDVPSAQCPQWNCHCMANDKLKHWKKVRETNIRRRNSERNGEQRRVRRRR